MKYVRLAFALVGLAYAGAAAFGLFARSSPLPVLWLAPASALALFLACLTPTPPLLLLAYLLANVAVQLTGGVASLLFAAYFPLVYLAVRRFDAVWVIPATLVLLAIDPASLYLKTHEVQVVPTAVLLVFSVLVLVIAGRDRLHQRELENAAETQRAKRALVAPRTAPDTRGVPVPPAARDINRPFRHIVDLISAVYAPRSVALFLAQGGDLVLVEGSSSEPGFTLGARIKPGHGVLGWVAKERKPLLVPDFNQDGRTLGYYQNKVPVGTVLASPILLGSELEGVIAVDSPAADAFRAQDRDGLASVAATLAVIIDALRSYEKKHAEAAHFSALSELATTLLAQVKTDEVIRSTLATIQKIFAPELASYAAVDSEHNTGMIRASQGKPRLEPGLVFNLDEGLVGWVARYRSYLINDNLKQTGLYRFARREPATDALSFLGVPITDKETVLGVLWLERRGEHAFVERDAEVFRFVGSLLSSGLVRARLYEQVEELAVRDGLTGLLNHRSFQEVLDRSVVTDRRFVLLLADLDNFKELNDRFGHPFGDRVLKAVADVLGEIPESAAARYGGEEFGIVLHRVDRDAGVKRAEDLRARVAALTFVVGDAEATTSISVGLAAFPDDGKRKADLIARADQGLYAAKQAGRNRVVAWRPELAHPAHS